MTKETWQDEAEDDRASPDWDAAGVPMCTSDECGQYDGKRCRLLGARPGPVCEPAVAGMASLLRRNSHAGSKPKEADHE